MATIKDIAKRTGLGLATISKYINGGTVRPKNKLAIDRAIEEMHYTVNQHARGLKTNRSMTIGAVIPELNNVFITTIMSSVTDALRTKGYGLLICGCRSDPAMEAESVSFLMRKLVDGIINMPVQQDGSHLLPAIEANIPVVLIDRNINALRGHASSVLVDNVSVAAQATQKLLDAGHTRIGIIAGPSGIFTSQQRLLGYNQAHMQSGLMPDPAMVVYGDYTVQGGHDAAIMLLQRGATAVFATNYDMTLGAMIAFNERGVHIPQQISFIGFDHTELSEVVRPRLTIVSQPLEQMGLQAAQILLTRLGSNAPVQPSSVVLPAEILWGDSVAQPQNC